MSKRNAHAVAARQRKAGPMSKRGRPYPDDVITPLEEEQYDRSLALEDEKAKQDLADRARDLFDELEVWELQQLLELAAKISK